MMGISHIDRRGFLRVAAAAGLATIAGNRTLAAGARTRAALGIGVIWPVEDAAFMGLRLGADEAAHAARLIGTEVVVHERFANDADTAAAADRLIDAGVHALVGGASPTAADTLIRAATASDVLFFNIGVPHESLEEGCAEHAFHVHVSDAMRRDAWAAAPDTPAGAAVVGWHPALVRYGAAQVSERFERAFAAPMTEPAWNGWIAIKIVFEAVQRTGSNRAADVAAHLVSERALFDGHKGVQLSFRPHTRQLRQPLYIVTDDAVLAEVPVQPRGGELTHAQLLDTIGNGDESCRG